MLQWENIEDFSAIKMWLKENEKEKLDSGISINYVASYASPSPSQLLWPLSGILSPTNKLKQSNSYTENINQKLFSSYSRHKQIALKNSKNKQLFWLVIGENYVDEFWCCHGGGWVAQALIADGKLVSHGGNGLSPVQHYGLFCPDHPGVYLHFSLRLHCRPRPDPIWLHS